MGTIYWQANDLWPVASWSSIDYHGRWKVLHHFAARFYAPLLGSMTHEDGKVTVWATSDLPHAVELSGELEVFTWSGKRIAHQPLRAKVGGGTTRSLGVFAMHSLLKDKAQPHEVCLFLRLRSKGISHENFATLVPWKWVTLPRPKIDVNCRESKSGIELVVSSPQVIPFFHAELAGHEGHFQGDWTVLRPGSKYLLPWIPHVHRGTSTPGVDQAVRALRTSSLYDTYEH
jgi:beta-mannosidase